jgi:hypothetical protein
MEGKGGELKSREQKIENFCHRKGYGGKGRSEGPPCVLYIPTGE